MLVISQRQYAVFQKLSEDSFVRALGDRLAAAGLECSESRSLARYAFDTARQRGMTSVEDIEAFSDVLHATGSAHEPAWCFEITSGEASQKADRLRKCLAASLRGAHNG